jgi:hypothetical protein
MFYNLLEGMVPVFFALQDGQNAMQGAGCVDKILLKGGAPWM